ncbi:MAG TPA: bifunctional adenosylcobinamide kinase/adenosylcobinamide-phosphate guanylyltransferase [Acidimicrobiales bacterium]|nr:bifunctional adenosylcobinamide kinase/adenosylcobinamide-phosphate guanylyltransferase [Acidimicrobiales bacterium]
MITLVLGGARSGKSAFAERLAASAPPPVSYVATALPGDDADFAERIRLHRERRPASWTTVECGADLHGAVARLAGTVLVDSLGTWLAALPGFAADPDELCGVLRRREGETILVSEEVGLGVHPSTALGGLFRDRLGELNRCVSEVAERAFLVVAGRSIQL